MKNNSLLKEFRPALKFVVIFAVVYFVGNTIYGLWIEDWKPAPDPMTVMVTEQVHFFLRLFGEQTTTVMNAHQQTISVVKNERIVVNVFEGCNSINVIIVFAAFMVAFGGGWKKAIPFITGGMILIYIANLLRVGLLYYTAAYRPHLFYYFHKYFFTALLYALVFALWYLWVRLSDLNSEKFASPEKQAE